MITHASTGCCKYCSEGGHAMCGGHIDGNTVVLTVEKMCDEFAIEFLMTFGGESLLYFAGVCKVHAAAQKRKIHE